MSATAAATSTLQNAHRRHVQSLYKRSLKLALDWYIQRDLWRQKALDIRAQFERNKHVTNPKEIQALLKNTEKELQSWAHPDPYKCTFSQQFIVEIDHVWLNPFLYSALGSRRYQVGTQPSSSHGKFVDKLLQKECGMDYV